MVSYWAVRLGEGGKYVEYGRRGNYIAVGWDKLGDLSFLAHSRGDTDGAIRRLYAEVYPESTAIQKGINVGEVTAFVQKIVPGDIVLVPKTDEAKALVAIVKGAYKYEKDPPDGCPYPNRKEVQ